MRSNIARKRDYISTGDSEHGPEREPPDIFRAAQNDDVHELNLAIHDGQSLTDRNEYLSNMTPLHVACVHSSNAFLVAASELESFDPWLRDDNLRVPFDHASARSNKEAQRLLFEEMYKGLTGTVHSFPGAER